MGSYSTTWAHPLIYKMKSSVFAIGLLLLATANASPPFLKAEDTCETLKCCETTTTTAAGTTTTAAGTTTTTAAGTTTTTNGKMKAVTTTTVAPTCDTLNCDCSGVGQIFSCVGILLVAF